jgi:aminomethyltransferase
MADQTEGTVMVAIQGPKIIERLADILPGDIQNLKRYHFVTDSIMLVKLTIFRSGYTGEDGVEIILPAKMASMALKMLGGKLDKPDATIQPAGLEAGMPLYGHELTETTDPISAGLGWAVDLTKDFIGAEALRAIKEKGPTRKLVGLELDSRRIARQGAAIKSPTNFTDAVVGEVTSGTFSPTLQKSIAMAYVDANLATEGTPLTADLKSESIPAKIVKLPFYKRSSR